MSPLFELQVYSIIVVAVRIGFETAKSATPIFAATDRESVRYEMFAPQSSDARRNSAGIQGIVCAAQRKRKIFLSLMLRNTVYLTWNVYADA
jgi:hypothetical protein